MRAVSLPDKLVTFQIVGHSLSRCHVAVTWLCVRVFVCLFCCVFYKAKDQAVPCEPNKMTLRLFYFLVKSQCYPSSR